MGTSVGTSVGTSAAAGAREAAPTQPTETRALALQILGAVLHQGLALDRVLAANDGLAKLPARDRAFARTLVATTLRRLGQLDDLIDHCLEKPLTPKPAELRDILRLGACQLAILGTAPHAAVDTSVALATGERLSRFRGLINAVLRRLAKEAQALIQGQDVARLATPTWLWQSWCETYGEASTRAMVATHLVDPPLDITVAAEAERWAAKLGATRLSTGSLRLPAGSGDIARLPGFEEGGWWVQDAAAALPARLLGDVAGRRVIDLCAAPGGKTAQLAAAGAQVIALDRSEKRLKQLASNLNRLGLRATTEVADALTWRPPAPADLVLLDAPCSATGTLRRHPDIAHLKTPDDVTKLAALQDRLLQAAVAMLAPGGVLVFATCSLQPEEGLARIDALLARRPGQDSPRLARLPIAPSEVGGLAEAITAEGDLQTLPCHLADAGGLDGFYACRLIRSA